MPDWDEMVLVGRIARPHGLRGEVAVEPETDFVAERFARGGEVWIAGDGGPTVLTIASSRVQGRRPLVAFEGLGRREDVEPLAGRELRVPEGALQALPEGRYYHHQLHGCVVETTDGDAVGTVRRVEPGVAGGCLVVEGRGGEVLIPLAADICVAVDVGARRIRIAPPDGLLELNARGVAGRG
jgi:16S rRNA processing protein RimM